jgi:hypothetical protein
MKLPDDLMHPSGGEHVDELAHNVLKLAHEAVDRFPEMKRKNMFLAGGAAISSAIIVAAGVAIMRRIRAGQQPDEAVRDVTEEELEGLRLVERQPYRPQSASNGTTEDHDEPATEDEDAGEVTGPTDESTDELSGRAAGQ